jgi:hypothetical protein
MGCARRIMRKERLVIWGWLLGILAVGMALRLHNVEAESLWLDEVATAIWSQLDLPSLVATIAARNDPPLLYLVTRMFVAILGDGEFVLRLPAVLFGSLSLLLAYKAGEILWSSQEGLLGAFLLAVNAYHIRYSQEARHYALMVFLALLSLIFLLKALQKGQKRLWIGFVVSTSLSLYNHAFAFLFLLAEIVYSASVLSKSWLTVKRGDSSLQGGSSQVSHVPARQALALVVSLALVGLSYLPWLPVFWGQASRHLASSRAVVSPPGPQLSLAFLREVVMTYSAGIGTGHLYLETASVGGVLAPEALGISIWQGVALLLFVMLFLYGLVGCGRKRLLLVVLWLGIPFAVLSFVTTKRFVHARYVLYILPLYLLVIARGTVWLMRILNRRPATGEADRKRILVLNVATALLLGLVSLESVVRYHSSHKEDWRAVAWYLNEQLAPHDIVLADGKAHRPLGDDGRVILCLSYYLESYGASETPIVPVRPIIWRDLKRLEHSDGSIWTVLWYPDRPATWDSVEEVTVVDFHDLAILRLREPSGNTLRDTLQILRVLVDLLPPEARFDVHLALGEIYLRTGIHKQAELELRSATQVKPDSPEASQDLDDARAQFLALSDRLDGVQHPLWRNLGDVVAFLGHDIHPPNAHAGATMEVTLWWQALAEMDRDYSVFVHVADQDGRIWAQVDSQVLDEDRPTSRWRMGDVAKVQYEMALAPDIPPGEYTVKFGMYYWETGERLPVWDESGQRLPGDTIVLGHISITD